ncbi:hypothetical protein [Aquimarina rubra]|uniref:Uncharacterized protein n=1 Tax=Aquimarina rubra TaxID=1920033 RepID=A0ABW5LH96_9FLAO
MKRKTIGYIFIVIALLMLLGLLTQIGEITNAFSQLLNSTALSTNEKGQLTGHLLYYLLHLALTIYLFTKGRQRLQ